MMSIPSAHRFWNHPSSLGCFSSSEKTISLYYHPQKGIYALLPNSANCQQELPVSFSVAPDYSKLRNFFYSSSKQEQQRFLNHFFLRAVCLSDGEINLTLCLRFLGGGACHSTEGSSKKAPRQESCFKDAVPPLSPLLPLGDIFPLKSSLHIASALKQLPSEHPQYPKRLALEMVSSYAERGLKDPAVVAEISVLAFAEHPEISRSLVKVFLQDLQDAPLLDLDILKALRRTLQYAPLQTLDPDDLVQTLRLVFEKLSRIHLQDQTSPKVYQTLRLVSDILDIMGDSGVIEVNRLDIHDPCYKILDALSNAPSLLLASEAAYAQQALVRIPNDESKLSSYLRHAFAAAQGIASLALAVKDQNPLHLLDAYTHFKEALQAQNKQNPWYNEMRVVRLLFEMGQFTAVESFLRRSQSTQILPFAGCAVALFQNVAAHHTNVETQKGALSFLDEIFLDEAAWADHELLKYEAALGIKTLTVHPNPEISGYAQSLLDSFASSVQSRSQQKALEKLDLRKVQPSSAFLRQTTQITTLFLASQRKLEPETVAAYALQLPAPDPDFTGRESLLKELSEIFDEHYDVRDPALVRVLIGPGGVGKSELALAFANDYIREFSFVWFIHCETPELFQQDLRNLAKALKLPVEDDTPFADVQTMLYRHLEQGVGKLPWLLIFDNVEKNMSLPQRGGYLLLTTRYSDVYPHKKAFLEVPVFSPLETQMLSEKICSEILPFQECERLCAALEGSTVLLNLALHYMAETNCSLDEYLKELDDGIILDDSSERYPQTLRQVVRLSLTRLNSTNPKAAQFLLLASHFSPDHIPEALLPLWMSREASAHPERERRMITSALVQSSLMRYNSNLKLFSLHRLTQRVLRQEENSSQSFAQALALIVQMTKEFDRNRVESWELGKEASLQAAALKTSPHWRGADQALASNLLTQAGKYFEEIQADSTAALECHREALKIRLQAYGDEHPDVASNYNDIGNDLRGLGKAQEALEYHQKALEIQLKVYGEAHPDVAKSYQGIGNSLSTLAKEQEALDYFKKALEIRLQSYGETHPDVGNCYHAIGNSLRRFGKTQEALEYHQKAMKIRLQACGEMHPLIAGSYNGIGSCLSSLGKHQEALEYHQKALAIRLKVYGEAHPSLAGSYNSIGSSLRILGKPQEALEYHQKALAILLKLYGEADPDMALTYYSIGSSLHSLGKPQEALEYHQKALAIWLKVYGEEHPVIAASYNTIGFILNVLGKPQEALEYQQKALALQLKTLDKQHPDVASSYNNIGASLDSLGKPQEALEYHQKALAIELKLYGEEHPSVAACYNSIGTSLRLLGKPQEALEYHQKALAIELKVLDEAHPNVANCYHGIGTSLRLVGKPQEALEYHQKALAIRLKVYDEAHPNVAKSYNAIGESLELLERAQEALEYHQKALAIRLKVYDEAHPEVAESYQGLGTSLGLLGKPQEALEYHQKALAIRLKLYGEEHPDVAKSFHGIGIVLGLLERAQEGLEYHQKALAIRLKAYDKAHPDVVESENSIKNILNRLGKTQEALEHKQE